MSFFVRNQTIPSQKVLQSTVESAPKSGFVEHIDYSIDGSNTAIPFSMLFSCHSINIQNVTGTNPTIALPSNNLLALLFKNPQTKALLSWTIETDDFSGNLVISSDDDSITIAAGIWILFIQVLTSNNGVYTFNLATQSTTGSLTLPSPGVIYIGNTSTTLSASGFNIVESSMPQIILLPQNLTGNKLIAFDTASSYWNKIFGGFRFPPVTEMSLQIMIINNTGFIITLTDVATTTGYGTVALPVGSLCRTYWLFTGVASASSASSLKITISEITF